MAVRHATFVWVSVAISLLAKAAAAQDCPTTISDDCKDYAANLAAGACIKPGSVFILNGKWEPAGRTKLSSPSHLRFFYVVDGKTRTSKYDAIFVSIDRVGLQDAHTDVKLTQNKEFKFKSKEEKDIYSRALMRGGQPTQPMRKWSYLPEFGSIFLKQSDVVSQFDIPQAIGDVKHAPHARLYRYATGNISCIPFGAGINSDVSLVLGKVIDSAIRPVKPLFFQVTIE